MIGLSDSGFDDIYCMNKNYDVKSRLGCSNPLFLCVISHTATSNNPGITVAGANKEIVRFTPAADAEFLYYGYCKCINSVPATPDGKPTPAIITKSALACQNIPFLVIDAGSSVRPSIPVVSFGLESGNDIAKGKGAMHEDQVKKALSYGRELAGQLAKSNDMIVIGESIPAGTTTALGVLLAMGIDARYKVSSSMPENPHQLKNDIVDMAMKSNGVSFGDLKNDPIRAVSLFGDPMLPSVAGLAIGAVERGRRVLLAGGTQMCAVLSLLRSLDCKMDGLTIGTTTYVSSDRHSNITQLMSQISEKVPIYAVDLKMENSIKSGLRAYPNGFVKEGVGAGGASIIAIAKSMGMLDSKQLLGFIEREYESKVENSLYGQHTS